MSYMRAGLCCKKCVECHGYQAEEESVEFQIMCIRALEEERRTMFSWAEACQFQHKIQSRMESGEVEENDFITVKDLHSTIVSANRTFQTTEALINACGICDKENAVVYDALGIESKDSPCALPFENDCCEECGECTLQDRIDHPENLPCKSFFGRTERKLMLVDSERWNRERVGPGQKQGT